MRNAEDKMSKSGLFAFTGIPKLKFELLQSFRYVNKSVVSLFVISEIAYHFHYLEVM